MASVDAVVQTFVAVSEVLLLLFVVSISPVLLLLL